MEKLLNSFSITKTIIILFIILITIRKKIKKNYHYNKSQILSENISWYYSYNIWFIDFCFTEIIMIEI